MSLEKRYASFNETFHKNVEKRQALRVNTLKISSEELVIRLEKKGVLMHKIPYLENGYWFDAEFSLGAINEYLQGYYYLQEGASQLPVLALDVNKEDRVLDMAAAPGSKTTQIAQRMEDKGIVVALDSDAVRLKALKNNLERLGIGSVICYKKDARFAKDLGLKFSKVLLDAPCSGNFCIEKNYFSKRTLDDVKQRARLQKELLKSAYSVLESNGTLVYSTCSLEPEENELVVDWFLKKYRDMKLEDTGISIGDNGLVDVLDLQLDSSISLTKRLWPHKTKTQGFFIAKLRKE